MPTAGPESFSPQQLDYLKRALGVDETVLWEDTPTLSAVQLSESIGNFDRVLLYFTKVNDPAIGTFVDAVWGVKTNFTLMHHVGAANAYIQLAKLGYDDSTYTITFVAGKNLGFGNYTTTTWSNPTVSAGVGDSFYLFKVVGIHRIAGGN